jgi:glutaconate CoA-transferase subunit A
MGVPLIGVRGLIGSDILRHRSDLQVIDNPFHREEQVVVAQPLRPDVAVLHALNADPWGNAITPGLRDDLMMARASRWVIVTTEGVAEKELTLRDAIANTFLPATDVDAVVHAPMGAHPCSCGDLYREDDLRLREYIEAAKEEKTFRIYLEQNVLGVRSHEEYAERVGRSFPTGGSVRWLTP